MNANRILINEKESFRDVLRRGTVSGLYILYNFAIYDRKHTAVMSA